MSRTSSKALPKASTMRNRGRRSRCTVGTAIQSIEIEQFFFSEEECMNRGALVGRAMFLHEIKPRR
jgi:hypothetical protein